MENTASLLHPEDFASIQANWNSKDQNLQTIARTLQLNLDSFVFVDDNPAERELVRAQLPDVAVPELGSPDDYCQVLDRQGYFEVTGLTTDDLTRNEMYRANTARAALQASFAQYEDYLKSLEMRAAIRDFEPVYLQRIAQLTNKTNQFNLTTKRFSEADIARIAGDGTYLRLYGRLEDRFGDNGVVSVVLGKQNGSTLHLELWLMSCRVLKRGMEYAMLDRLVEICRARKIQKIVGYYLPTAKNGMVKELYGDFGFTKVNEDSAGNTVWEYVPAHHTPRNTVIEVRTEEETEKP